MNSDETNRLLDRLEEILNGLPGRYKRRTPVRRRSGKDGEQSRQPSLWWSSALAPHLEFVRRSEDLCRRIEFNATSFHHLAAFARARYRIPERKAGAMLNVTITDCPLAGMHCDGDPALCRLGVAGILSDIKLDQ